MMPKKHRMNWIGRAVLLFALLFLGALLFGCASVSNAPENEEAYLCLKPGQMQNLAVVRSDSASDLVVREALRIRELFQAVTGESVPLNTDWERNGDDSAGEKDGYEVLVGLTTREESRDILGELREGDFFLIRTVGKRILVAATSEALLADAVDYFLNEFVEVDGLEDAVYIPRDLDYRSESYAFLSIARGGEARCDFVLSSDAGKELREAVNDVVTCLNEDYHCRFRILEESDRDLAGDQQILVGNFPEADALSSGEGRVQCLENRVLITGSGERQVIAALGEFYALLKQNRDTDYAGMPYAHWELATEISVVWQHKLPYPLGSCKSYDEAVSENLQKIAFVGVDEDCWNHYHRLLENAGFALHHQSSKVIAVSADFSVEISFDQEEGEMILYLQKLK